MSNSKLNCFITFNSKCEESPIGCSENNVACIAHEGNLIEYVGEISDVAECRQLCHDEASCEYLTYYDANSFPYREVCLLLKDCRDQAGKVLIRLKKLKLVCLGTLCGLPL